jgi:hypothetical protein
VELLYNEAVTLGEEMNRLRLRIVMSSMQSPSNRLASHNPLLYERQWHSDGPQLYVLGNPTPDSEFELDCGCILAEFPNTYRY